MNKKLYSLILLCCWMVQIPAPLHGCYKKKQRIQTVNSDAPCVNTVVNSSCALQAPAVCDKQSIIVSPESPVGPLKNNEFVAPQESDTIDRAPDVPVNKPAHEVKKLQDIDCSHHELACPAILDTEGDQLLEVNFENTDMHNLLTWVAEHFKVSFLAEDTSAHCQVALRQLGAIKLPLKRINH